MYGYAVYHVLYLKGNHKCAVKSMGNTAHIFFFFNNWIANKGQRFSNPPSLPISFNMLKNNSNTHVRFLNRSSFNYKLNNTSPVWIWLK